MTELAELGNSDVAEVAALSKFALAQAKESDGKLDEAAQLYSDLAKLNSVTVTPETANLRLAKVYEKQGKKKEAADLLFNIVDASRKAKGADKLPCRLLRPREKPPKNSKNSIRIDMPNSHLRRPPL